MKIALIREKVKKYGGAEKNVWFLAQGLSTAGHEVHVFAADWDDEIPGVTYHRVAYFRHISFLKPLFFAVQCKKMIGRETFDVVHSFDRTFSSDVYRAGDGCHIEWMRRLGRERGCIGKIFIWLNPKNIIQLYVEKKLLHDPRLKRVITNSEMVKKEMCCNYGLPPEKIAVIYNGVETVPGPLSAEAKSALRKKYGFTADDFLILFVGSNFERKGLRYLIEGVVGVPHAKIVVVGKGDEKRYRKIAAADGVAGRVFFFGPQKGIADYYQMSDIFVLPTLYDPFSNVTLEAMSYGLPVITTPDNGASEIVEDGKEGFVVSNDDLKEKIMIMQNKDVIRAMGQGSFEKAKRYSVQRVINDTLHVYMV